MAAAPIRAIVGRFAYDSSVRTIEAVLKERPFEFCAIISTGATPKFFTGIPASAQQWFVSSEIRGCRYGDVMWDTLAPIDETLIEKMRDCEATFMDLLFRQEWNYSIPYPVRREWYLKHLRFWNDYLDRNRINLYLSAWLPHEVPDIIIYHLCKQKNIPVRYFHMSTERDTAFLESDIKDSAIRIKPRYEALLKEFAGKDAKEIPVSERFEERFRALTATTGEQPAIMNVKVPGYWDRVLSLFRSRPWMVPFYALRYFTPRGFFRALGVFERFQIIRERNAFYDAHAITPNWSEPFVYLALHFQPEASTVPMAGAFSDQKLIAEMISAALPKGVLLYIKEHPRESSWLCRDTAYYQRLIALPNVRLVARSTDTFALRERAVAVATASGSVGFEALFRGKPVLLFGYRFYQYARGVYQIRAKEDLQIAIGEIFEKKNTPTVAECRLYLKAMEDTCVHGVVNPWDHKVSRLSDDEHVRATSEAVLKELALLDGSKAGS
jgi:hypothetical protein